MLFNLLAVDGMLGFSAALVLGLIGLGGAIGMGLAVSKSAESIARQPEAEGKIRQAMMIGLVFIETLAIYGILIAILILFA